MVDNEFQIDALILAAFSWFTASISRQRLEELTAIHQFRRISRANLVQTGHSAGMFFKSFIQTMDSESLGARQSPRGDSEPPVPTFGAFGMHERLN